MLIPRDPTVRAETAGRHAAVHAAVSIDDIRQAFYNDVLTAEQYWWWIREMRLNPMELIVDDDDGQLYRVPFMVNDDDTVTFQKPTPVEITYVDVPPGQEGDEDGRGEPSWPVTVAAAAPTQILASRWATRVEAGAPAHAAMTGTHVHAHPAMGSQGDDATHTHAHTHNGDANHDHEHASMAPAASGVDDPGAASGAVTAPLHRAGTAPAGTRQPAAAAASGTDGGRADASAEGGPDVQLSPEQLKALGLEPDATDEQVSAALNAKLLAPAESASAEGEGQAAAGAGGEGEGQSQEGESEQVAASIKLPPGIVAVDEKTLAEIKRGAQAGAALAAQQAEADRVRRVDAAIGKGQVAPAARKDWLERLAGPDGAVMAAELEKLPVLLPVGPERGYQGGETAEHTTPTAYPAAWAASVSEARRHSGARVTVGND